MKNIKKDLTTLTPVKNYTPPELPTLQDARKDPMLLKNLPSRWQNNTKVITCMGLITAGMLTLTGCAGEGLSGLIDNITERSNILRNTDSHYGVRGDVTIYVDGQTEQEISAFIPTQIITEELELRAHHGGAAAGPFYVVYLTEQEAMSIIRSQLEIAGLRFDATPPGNVVEVEIDEGMIMYVRSFGIDLFDANKGVGIVNIGRGQGRQGRWLANQVEDKFAQQRNRRNRISVGAFYAPGLSPDSEFDFSWNLEWFDDLCDEELAEAKEMARPILEERLNTYIQDFITFLQTEGIL